MSAIFGAFDIFP